MAWHSIIFHWSFRKLSWLLDFSRWRSTCEFLKLNWAQSLFLFQKETTNYSVINIIKSLIIYEKNGKKVQWVYKNNNIFLTFVYTFSSIFSVSKPTSFWTKFLKTRLLKFLCFTSCIQHCISNLIQHGRILLFSSYKSNIEKSYLQQGILMA